MKKAAEKAALVWTQLVSSQRLLYMKFFTFFNRIITKDVILIHGWEYLDFILNKTHR